jgi:AcrR family transcriptional regulator
MHVAAGLFAAQGFAGTTTAQICAAAGISPGHLFHYFSSKRDLFAAILTDHGSQATEQALDAARATADPLAGLLDFVDHLAAAAAEPGAPGLVLEAMLQAVRDPELAERLGADADVEEAGVAELLARTVGAGAADPGLDVAATAAWIMAMVGATYLAGATNERFDPARQLPVLRLTVQRLLAPGAGR